MSEYHQGQKLGPRSRGLAILDTEISIMTTALKRSNVWSRSDAVSGTIYRIWIYYNFILNRLQCFSKIPFR